MEQYVFQGIGFAVHLVAAVVWIGGLASLVVGLRPALNRAIVAVDERDRVWAAIHRRFVLVASLAAAILLASGFMMMTADPHFKGFGDYSNAWSKLLVVKHGLFVLMLLVLLALRKPRDAKAERDLVDISLMLGIAVLVVTGLLTAIE
ncbi:MAG TPA: hypothetical protein VMV18_03180 [bacterium]|nr:hypothetical protein [bacterium]